MSLGMQVKIVTVITTEIHVVKEAVIVTMENGPNVLQHREALNTRQVVSLLK
jgi:hypothetical protein